MENKEPKTGNEWADWIRCWWGAPTLDLTEAFRRAMDQAREEAIRECAKLVEDRAQLYSTDIFSEPTEDSPIDCWSAKMARHCSQWWAEDIRALLSKCEHGKPIGECCFEFKMRGFYAAKQDPTV